MKIYTYRYLWNVVENDEMKSCVKQICGTMEEQNEFCRILKAQESVVKACQIYVCEYDVDLIEKPIIVKEKN